MSICKALGTLFTTAAVIILSACAGSQGADLAPPASSPRLARNAPRRPLAPAVTRKPPDLYVVDEGANAVDVLRNKTYREVGLITYGIATPLDDFLDSQGNLYVSNQESDDIAEYAPGSDTPSFTYSSEMSIPVAVAVDAHGTVYEGDFGNDSVREYFQKDDASKWACQPGGAVTGVAVDLSNDVFVRFAVSSSGPYLVAEYPGGLSGCNETILGVSLSATGGIAIDQNGNLLAGNGSEIAVIDPPYTSITGTIGAGFTFVDNVTLNRRNTKVFAADPIGGAVTVINYPSGTNEAVLGSAYGITFPTAAVDQPNAVY